MSSCWNTRSMIEVLIVYEHHSARRHRTDCRDGIAGWRFGTASRSREQSIGRCSGHARLSQRLAKLLPFYEYGESQIFESDRAPADVVARRRIGFERLARCLSDASPLTVRATDELESGLSDLQFVNAYRVPFQVRGYVRRHLKVGALAQESSGVLVRISTAGLRTISPAPTARMCSGTTSTRNASTPASNASAIWVRCSARITRWSPTTSGNCRTFPAWMKCRSTCPAPKR